MNIYSIKIDGKEVATERQIYHARDAAQRIANETNKETEFTSPMAGKETFKPHVII